MATGHYVGRAIGPDGKPVKPADWKPPDIEGVLRAQGWKPTEKTE
jgi:hypothetical protein